MRIVKLPVILALAGTVFVPAASASGGPQTTWAKVGRKPLSDRAAASRVRHVQENRPANTQYNRYYVTNADLRTFRTTKDSRHHQTSVHENPWNAYVTGRSFLRRPSTDDLIQWAAFKWGIPVDLLRAQTAFESGWLMNNPGDLTKVRRARYRRYSPAFRRPGLLVWQSAGITQIKWLPDGSVNVGTEPLRRKSTAFDLDYMGATIRYYYDGKCNWCGKGYHARQGWLSIGAWNRPKPWGNARQWWYVGRVKHDLATRAWTQYK